MIHVGETECTVDEPIEHHLAGIDGSAHVRRGRTDLETDGTWPSRLHATEAETALGRAFQERGFVVEGPQWLDPKPRVLRRE